MLGVSVDDVDSHKKFCAKEDLDFKLLADTNKTVSLRYGSLTNLVFAKFSARHTFLINADGQVAKVYTRVDPVKHSAEVLEALAQLQESPKALRHDHSVR